MGEYFRRSWLPVALSCELPEPDGTQTRVRGGGALTSAKPSFEDVMRERFGNTTGGVDG